MSQQQLADLLGMTHGAIGKLETGRLELKARQIRQIAQAFGVHPGTILAPLPAANLADDEQRELIRLLRNQLFFPLTLFSFPCLDEGRGFAILLRIDHE